MRKEVLVPSLLAIIGIIFLTGGASAYFVRSGTTAMCEACGMEIKKDDPSTFSIVSADGETHYGCCPVCALIIAIYYNNASAYGNCFECEQEISFSIVNANLTSVTPTGGTYNVSMVFGMMCMKNKMVCSSNCANTVKNSYDWAGDLPLKTAQQTFNIAAMKYADFSIGYKPLTVPILTYALIGIGLGLIVSAPLSWILMKRRASKPV